MKGRRSLATVGITAAIAMLAGCNHAQRPQSPGSSDGSEQAFRLVHDGFISTSKRGTDAFFPDAEIHGRLRLRSGCLLVGDYVAVFTADFTWDPATRTLTWPQGSATPGDPVEFGGGGEPPGAEKTEPLLSPTARQEIERCLGATGATTYSFMTSP